MLNMDWLRMFDHRELQTLISGAEVPVDVDDLKQHTNYSGMKCKHNAVCFRRKACCMLLLSTYAVRGKLMFSVISVLLFLGGGGGGGQMVQGRGQVAGGGGIGPPWT